jgi:hypothetical protein
VAGYRERKELTPMEDGQRVQNERRVQLFGKVEPVLEDLYRQLCMEENMDDAEAILVALSRVRAELATGNQRLGPTSML